MRRSTDEATPIADLPALFDHPLDTVKPLTVRSNGEAQTILERLKSDVHQKSDWTRKCTAIQDCISYLKGDSLQFPDFDPLALVPGVADGITDARSTLVKWSCLFVAAIGDTVGNRCQSCADLIVPKLFQGTSNGSAVIKHCCRLSLLHFAAHVQSRKTLATFLDRTTAKSSDQRCTVAQILSVIHERWPFSIYKSSLPDLKNSLRELQGDKHPDVRSIARQIPPFDALRATSPKPQRNIESSRASPTRQASPRHSPTPTLTALRTLPLTRAVVPRHRHPRSRR
jgi:hypothetical protein